MVAECRCETLPSRVPSSIYRKYVVSHQKIIAITVTGLLFALQARQQAAEASLLAALFGA